jgi:two-component system OmpR family sensor kinase
VCLFTFSTSSTHSTTRLQRALEEVERLFEPFVRGSGVTEKRVEGAGLGLAIVRDQAEAIGGLVDVGVSPFGGARFTLDLPAEITP